MSGAKYSFNCRLQTFRRYAAVCGHNIVLLLQTFRRYAALMDTEHTFTTNILALLNKDLNVKTEAIY
jgi:hypothetical protein